MSQGSAPDFVAAGTEAYTAEAALAAARHGYLTVDAAGTVKSSSPGFAAWARPGLALTGLIHPAERAHLLEALAEAAQNAEVRHPLKLRLPLGSGKWGWHAGHAINRLGDPKLAALLLVLRPGTEGGGLATRFEMAERAARFGHWRWAFGDEAPTWSAGLYALLGFDSTEGVHSGDWMLSRVHPDDRAATLSQVRAAVDTRRPVFFTTRMKHADGRYRACTTHGRIEYDPSGAPAAVVGVCQDVTEIAEAGEALRRSEAQYRLLTENASDIISLHARDGTVLFVSPAIERILGFTPQELLGTTAGHYIAGEDRRPALDAMRGLSQRGTVTICYRARHKSGHVLWIETTVRALSGQEAPAGAFISVSRDVDARKKAELALQEARERAEAASRTKSRFLANMSHELRTPLNAIIGFSEIIRDGMFGPIGARYADYARLIHESGQLLLALINDILDMSKIEAGKFELHYEDVPVAAAVDGALTLVRRAAEARGLALSADVQSPELRLRADRRAVTQILLNLLSNAVKFTPEGGAVRVSARAGGGAVIFSVSDTGVGIPAGHIERLGRPFEQVRGEPGTSHPGTGLGLALVRSLAQLHGGEVAIASAEGLGTTVTVSLPSEPRLRVSA